jgi:AcrR family transcriptional regulator
MVQQERSSETRQALIDAAAARLWGEDESELRIADICDDTGLSSSVIYSNFRSRQGLIDATFLDMYAHLSAEYIGLLTRNAEAAQSKDSLIDFFANEATFEEVNTALQEYRRMRLRIATAALSRESLRNDFIAIQESHLDRFAAMLEDLQLRGVIGSSLTGRQFAVLLEGFSFGRALDDISPKPESNETWLKMLHMILNAV